MRKKHKDLFNESNSIIKIIEEHKVWYNYNTKSRDKSIYEYLKSSNVRIKNKLVIYYMKRKRQNTYSFVA